MINRSARRRILMAAAITSLLAGEGIASAGVAHANAFTGSCQLSGSVAFTPPLTNSPQAVEQRVHARGTCSGTFINNRGREHQLNNASVAYLAEERSAEASCTAGTATGGG
jgi:hypothetical protein